MRASTNPINRFSFPNYPESIRIRIIIFRKLPRVYKDEDLQNKILSGLRGTADVPAPSVSLVLVPVRKILIRHSRQLDEFLV